MTDYEFELDRLADGFEAGWIEGTRPDLLEFLKQVGPDHEVRLAELLIPLDIEYRIKTGENVSAADYRGLGDFGESIAKYALEENAADSLSQQQHHHNLLAGEFQRFAHQHLRPQTEAVKANAVPATFGDYQLLEKLGEGGMGEVWIAEQTHPVKLQVALKLIKKGFGSKEVMARFEIERQSLALMNHPNIARILNAGTTPEGQPWFAMELVRGKTLIAYCDEHCLGINERLKLFMDVCQGVQHAHQKGIIHRDLKPSNILVEQIDPDSPPVAKVIDFGLAKATESTQRLTDQSQFTGIGQVLGTLKYMSPEQAGLDTLDIDTRTDIYSLGIILYELLTGSTPLDDRSLKDLAWLKLLDVIREKEPVKPSSRLGSSTDEQVSQITSRRRTDRSHLNSILAGDLDWIVMKALEKDRARRYDSVSGFAADVRRYMSGEPVVARPPSMNYRLRKFVRKNRVGVAAGVAILLTLVGGIIGTSLAVFRARCAEILAEKRLDEATAARDREMQQRRVAELAKIQAEAETAAKEQSLAAEIRQREYAEAVTEFVEQDFLALTCVESQANLFDDTSARELSKDTTLRELLDRAAGKLKHRKDLAPEIESRLCNVIGNSYRANGDAEIGLPFLQRALELRREYLGHDHLDTFISMNNLALGYFTNGQLGKALPLFEQTMELREAKLGSDHPDTLTSMSNLAVGYHASGKFDKALPLLKQSLDLFKAELGPDHPQSISSIRNLAVGYQASGKLDKALPLLERTLELTKAKLGIDHPDTLISMNNLASGYKAAGQLDKALPIFEKTLELMKTKFGLDHPNTLTSMNNLAVSYQAVGQFDKALPLLERTLELTKAKLGIDHPDTLISMNNLASGLEAARQFDKALPIFEQTLELTRAKLGLDHRNTLTSMHNLAFGYQAAGRLDKALPLYERTLELQKAKLGTDHPDTVHTMNNLASAYEAAGRLSKALPLLEQTLDLMTVKFGPDHPDTLTSINNLARCYKAAAKLEKALPLFEQTVQLRTAVLGLNHPDTLDSINNLAHTYWKSNRLSESVPLFEQVLELTERMRGFDQLETLKAKANLGVNYKDAGRIEEAIPLLEEAWSVFGRQPSLAWLPGQLLDAYWRGQRAEAFSKLAHEELKDARKTLAVDSRELANLLVNLGGKHLHLKLNSQAAELLREGLAIRQQQSPDVCSTFNAQFLLGGALLGLVKEVEVESEKSELLIEAETLLISGYEGMKQRESEIPPQAATRIPEALDRLIELYKELEKPDEVVKYRELRAAYPMKGDDMN